MSDAQPFLDWLLYLCRNRLHQGTTLQQPGDIRTLGGARLGAVFITQPEPPDPANAEHRQNVDRARQAIGL